MKKIIAFLLTVVILLSLCPVVMADEDEAVTPTGSVQLKALGNKLVFADDENVEVRLTGVNVCGCEWTGTPKAEAIKTSVDVAMDEWDCNLIRLAISRDGWWGRYDYVSDGGAAYRQYIIDVVNMVSDAGKYIIVDLHEFGYVNAEHIQFWQEVATTFKNNPAVIFGMFNEPHGDAVTWETWRNGNGGDNKGVQPLLEAIRDTGAKNLVTIGGIKWAGTLDGIAGGGNYDLIDQGSGGDKSKAGYGIIYDVHFYPSHGHTKEWKTRADNARKKYPILVGEFGWDPTDTEVVGENILPESDLYHDKWLPEMYDWLEDDVTYGTKANWTAWCFHDSSKPKMLYTYDDNGIKFGQPGYAYKPTEYSGEYVKSWLCEQRGINLAENKTLIKGDSQAIDGDKATAWQVDGELVVDLGTEYTINRWQMYHNNTITNASLMLSIDGNNWVQADNIVCTVAKSTDRYISPVKARYAKLTDIKGDSPAITEFRVVGDAQVTGEIDCSGASNTTEVISQVSTCSYYDGKKFDVWWSEFEKYPTYPANASEDGKGKVMRVQNGGENEISMDFTGFRDLNGFSYFEYKYKSDVDTKVFYSLLYDFDSSKNKKTNTITLPSTNGEWKTFRITTEMLMPTPSDTWVKTDLSTKWVEPDNFMPVLLMNFNLKSAGTVDVEYVKAVWTSKGGGGLNLTSAKVLQNGNHYDKLQKGTARVTLRYQNGSTGKMNYLLTVIGVYDEAGKLVSVAAVPFNVAGNAYTKEYTANVDVPYDNCSIKLFTWKDAAGMEPVTGVVEY